ncbi:MAG: glutaredoxin [Rhizobiaceae bacterium]|nr:glutaredoxin [Hyphomicrobiales bacterium]NRB32543.1 glutaredoxin [Rhizobiaceae bacterium]
MTTATARLYRMEMREHICPSGLKAKALLERKGIAFEDNKLSSRAETDAFKAKHEVETTPQIWIDGKRVGGFDALLAHFGEAKGDSEATSYTPVIALFAMTALMAMAASFSSNGSLFTILAAEWFIAFSMCVLAVQKLRDLDSFADQFITYDLLAMRWLPYAKIYPFAEGGAGVLMIAAALNFVSIPVALFIGGLGAVSVVKAVYVDKRDLRCACVGGNSNVPLGFISLTENVMMVLMAVWMIVKSAV